MPTENRQIILIVDDTAANIQVLNESLQAEYRILFATTGCEALKVASESNPDLILLDIMMPEMDGYEVCQRVKADPALKDIPVIFTTALSEVVNEKKGLDLGAADYVTKPINHDILRLRVKNHLKLKKQRDQLAKLVDELQEAMGKVKLLSGLLPICASCKKIRNDKGYWTQIELYIKEHSEAEFSHGICPVCVKKLYPLLSDEDGNILTKSGESKK
ncbi:MAG: response regulator [Chromatiales bacterium]|nr:response regulator [Chromatiales bacterium]